MSNGDGIVASKTRDLDSSAEREEPSDTSKCCCGITKMFRFIRWKIFKKMPITKKQKRNSESVNTSVETLDAHEEIPQHTTAPVVEVSSHVDIQVHTPVIVQNHNVPVSAEDLPQKRRQRKKNNKTKRAKIEDDQVIPPAEIEQDPRLKIYWRNRYSLFSKYDQGIKLDPESWYSVTPELTSKQIAERCRSDVIVDGFCGAGGNTIQFAFTCERVIAIDIDPKKIELAKNNARVYKVDDRIEFIVGNYFEVIPTLKADVVFLSPPWGGPGYTKMGSYKLENMLEPYGGEMAFRAAKQITDHVAFYLPRNIDREEIIRLAGGEKVEIEKHYRNDKLLAVTAYYGELVLTDEDEEEEAYVS